MVIGFDIDGTFTNFENFTKRHAIKYFKKRYNLDVADLNGYDVDDIFDLPTYVENNNPDFSKEQIRKEVKKIMSKFWIQYYPLYIAAPFREGIKQVIEQEKKNGNIVKIFSSRDMTCEDSLRGKVAREATLFQINVLNNIKHDGLFLYPNDKEKIEGIKRHRVSIMFEDKPEMLNEVSKFTKVIGVTTPYNKKYQFNENVIMVNGENVDNINKALDSFKTKLNKPLEVYENELPSKEQIWKKHYKTTDGNYILERKSPYDRMVAQIKDYPNDVVFSYSNTNKKMRVKEYINNVDICAEWLTSKGIGKGDVVPLLTLNTFETVIMITALLKLKATIVPISPLESKSSIESKIINIDKKIKLIYLVDFWQEKDQCHTKDKVKDLDVDTVCYSKVDFFSLPFSDRVNIVKKILKEKNYYKTLQSEYDKKYINFNSIMKNTILDSNKVFYDEKHEDFTACLMYTSGTLVSKGVMLSGDNIDAEIVHFYNSILDLKRQEKISGFLPYDHVFGLLLNLIVPTALGIETVLVPNFDRDKLKKLVKKDKVNYLALIPVLLNTLIKNNDLKVNDLKKLKKIFSGSSTISNLNEIEKFFKEKNANVEIIDGYGASELTCVYLVDGIPLLNSDAKIIDVHTGKELGYNEVGELCISGPTMMKGYHNNPDFNKKALKQHEDGKIWLHTGDLFYINNDGKFKFQGRVEKDFIKVSGKQVNLFALKQLIETIDLVKECVIIDVSDSKKGRVPVAFVEPTNNNVNLFELEDTIMKLCRDQLASYERPVYIHFMNSLPLTMRGKTDRKYFEENYENIIIDKNKEVNKVLVKANNKAEVKS